MATAISLSKFEDQQIKCSLHPEQDIISVDINNYSTKKLLCSKCIKNNHLIDECEIVSFDDFAKSIQIVKNNFKDLCDDSIKEEEVMKMFNGICSDEKIETFQKNSVTMTSQLRVNLFSQIQETCDQFIRNLNSSLNSFKQQLQENLKGLLQNYLQIKYNDSKQAKAAEIVSRAIEERKSYNEVEDLIKQLHSGKLELKFAFEGLNTAQDQIKSTLNDLLDAQKKAIDSSLNTLKVLIPPYVEPINSQQIQKLTSLQPHNYLTPRYVCDSPLKYMRLTNLKQNKLQHDGSSQYLIKQNQKISPQKTLNKNQISLTNLHSSGQNQLKSQVTSQQQNQTASSREYIKDNSPLIQQRNFFKERFVNSLNTINILCDKNQISCPKLDIIHNNEILKVKQQQQYNDADSLSDIRNNTSSSPINTSDSQLQPNKPSQSHFNDKKIKKEEKLSLIQSLYYQNHPQSKTSEKEKQSMNELLSQNIQPACVKKSQIQHNSCKSQSSSTLESLLSTNGNQQKFSSEQASPTSSLTICQSTNIRENINCILKMENNIIIVGTEDGNLLVCDTSSPSNNYSNIYEISIKTRIKAHYNTMYLSQCPSNTDMFFSVGYFKENSSSIKLWTLTKDLRLVEVVELRDFHQTQINQIIVLKEELIKNSNISSNTIENNNNNSSDQLNQNQQKQTNTSSPQGLSNVITIATFSKVDSFKIWKISYKDGKLSSGIVSKLIDISLKNLSIKSELMKIENNLYVANANRIFCYEFNEDYSAIKKENKTDLFISQNHTDYIQHIKTSHNLIGVISHKSQFTILTQDLIIKRNIPSLHQLFIKQNNQLEHDKIFITYLIPLWNNHFGIGFCYNKQKQKVSIFNGQSCKLKQTINEFDHNITLVEGIHSDYKIILVEAKKHLKIQRSWINQKKNSISFQE